LSLLQNGVPHDRNVKIPWIANPEACFFYLQEMKSRSPLFLLFALLAFQIAQAQVDKSKIDKKAIEAYTKGLNKLDEDKYKDAIESFQEAIRRDGKYIDAYLSLAGVYGQLKDHQNCIANYEKAFALDSNYASDFRLPYAINLAGAGEFQKALTTINNLLTNPNTSAPTRKASEYRKKTFQFAVDFDATHPQRFEFKPKNLGEGVNTEDPEYFPSMPIEGKDLIFTRNIKRRNEDFFLSHNSGEKWENAFRLNGSINTPDNEGAQTISQDGSWLIFTGCNRGDGAGSCDLYISYRTKEGWSEAINLGGVINTDQWESQPTLSPDKRDLYFASRRFGGYGGSDIYVSHLLSNGRWSQPENLGPDVNTAGDETEPFIHADNQTLYFGSNGLAGYGGEDLFMIRKNSDGKWSRPENLGYPINTINNDGSLFIASDGYSTYFASDRSDSRGSLDIYSFDMRPEMRPAKTLWVKGKVYDIKTSAGLPSTVELIDLASKQTMSRLQTDENGNYLVTLPIGKDYAFNVNRKGYLFYSDNFFLKEKSPDSTYNKDIPLKPIEVNAAVVLKNIFFDFSKYELKTESEAELDKVVQFLQDNPSVHVVIEGHTDNVGKAADNQKLSHQRAIAVVNYLVIHGISSKRLTAVGLGTTKPVAPNNTEEGRAQNRRTELKVTVK
jgi:outer membrane protein OmpA-like peptidoglycan-associated protein/tetratricopeptide (TPR) repeat protein